MNENRVVISICEERSINAKKKQNSEILQPNSRNEARRIPKTLKGRGGFKLFIYK